MTRKLRILFTCMGVVLLIGTVITDDWDSLGERLAYAVLAICILAICQPSAFASILKWALNGTQSILAKTSKQTADTSAITGQTKAKQGPDRVISTQEGRAGFLKEYTVIDERRTKVVGVTYKNEDGSNRQSILPHCHAGDKIFLRYFEYYGAPAYGGHTEYGQIGNLSKDLAWELGQYGDDIYVDGRILAITGGHKGLSFGCNIALTIYGPK